MSLSPVAPQNGHGANLPIGRKPIPDIMGDLGIFKRLPGRMNEGVGSDPALAWSARSRQIVRFDSPDAQPPA